MFNVAVFLSASVSQHVFSSRGCVAVLMPDHLDAQSGTLGVIGHQDRPQSRLPSGSRSDVTLAVIQIKKLLYLRLTLSKTKDERLHM